MPDFQFVRSLIGMTPQLVEYLAGSDIEQGDIVIFSSGEVVVPTDEAVTPSVIAGLAMETVKDTETVSVMPLNDYIILEGTAKGTITDFVAGGKMHLDVTSDVQTVEMEAASAVDRATCFQMYKVIDATAKTVQFRYVGSVLFAEDT